MPSRLPEFPAELNVTVMADKGNSMGRPRTGLKQRWQSLVRKHFWRMDIHPSAWIASTSYIDRTWPKGIHIAADCLIDHAAVVLTHDLTRGVYLDTRIGTGTTIGARAIIFPGVTIGSGCRIEPGSVVTHDVPDNARTAGNPARILDEA